MQMIWLNKSNKRIFGGFEDLGFIENRIKRLSDYVLLKKTNLLRLEINEDVEMMLGKGWIDYVDTFIYLGRSNSEKHLWPMGYLIPNQIDNVIYKKDISLFVNLAVSNILLKLPLSIPFSHSFYSSLSLYLSFSLSLSLPVYV